MVAGRRDAEESRAQADIPMNRMPRWLPWAGVGLTILGGAIYVGGLGWGLPLGVAVCLVVQLSAGALLPRIAPPGARRMITWARGRPNLTVFTLGTVLCISAVGAVLHRDRLAHQAAECAEAKSNTRRNIEIGDPSLARAALKHAENNCDPSERAELGKLELDIQAAEARAAERAAREQAEHQALSDRAAEATFPERAAAARALLKKAAAIVAKGDLPAATVEFARADAILREFKGTSVEKAPEYVALRAEADKVLQAVRPYIAQVEAALLEAKRQNEAQAEQDRRDGVKITKDGYAAAASREKLEQAIRYATADDMEGLGLLLEQDPGVTVMKAGLRVVVVERADIPRAMVRVRLRGTLDEFWTIPEALREP